MKKIAITLLFGAILLFASGPAWAADVTIKNAPDGARTGAQLLTGAANLAVPLDDGAHDYYATMAALIDMIEASDLTLTGAVDLSGATLTGAIASLVEDTSPQLGGNLDLNTHVITGLEIGTDVQAYSANLGTIAALTPEVGKVMIGVAGPAWGLSSFTLTIEANSTLNQDVTSDANPSFSTLNLVGTDSLTLGTASTNLGQITFKNSTNANEFVIQPGATGAALSWTFPIAAPGGANYLLNVDADGTMGYTDPSGLVVSESDPIVGAITGIVKADGATNISAAVAMTDYVNPAPADGTLIDLSGITMTVDTDEGLALPTYADVAPHTEKYYVAYDASNNALMVRESGGWVNVGASAAAPTSAKYLVFGASGNLTDERVLTEGTAIDFTDAGTDGGAYTVAFDSTELGTTTWGSGAAIVWTFNASAGTDPTITFGDGTVAVGGTLSATAFSGDLTGDVTGNADTATLAGTVTVVDSSDASSYIAMVDSATGSLAVKTDTGLTYNASTGVLTATGFSGPLTGDVTGNVSGTAATVTGAAQANITSLGTLTGLTVSGAIVPNAANTIALGSTSAEWSDAYFGDGAIIYGQNDQSATLTSSASTWTASAFTSTGTLTANGNTVIGDANTDTLAIQSLIVGGDSRAVWIAGSAPTPSYATDTDDLYVDGDTEVAGTIYAAAIDTGTGSDGSRAITMASNTSISPVGDQIYFLNDVLKVSEGGTERDVVTPADSVTWTGTSHNFSAVTNMVLSAATPDAAGEIGLDTTNHILMWHDGANVIKLDTTSPTDTYVLKYSSASGTATWQADDTAGSPTLNTVGDPVADTTIAMDLGEEVNFQYTGNYTTGSQFLVQQLTGNPSGGVLFEVRSADADTVNSRFGDGTNYVQIATSGALTLAGTASITAGGLVLNDSTPDGNGEIGYASNHFNWYANSEDMVWTAGADTWTFSSNTGAHLVLGSPVMSPAAMAIASQATGDLLYASSASAWARLADVAAGQPLLSGGVTTAPAYAGYTLSGTAAQTYTFPSTTATLARTDAGQTFTGVNVFTAPTFTTSIAPTAAGASTIGTTALEWGNIYLADGGVIYFQNDQSVYLTPSAVTLTLTGTLATTAGVTVGTSLLPDAADGAVIGSSSAEWSDLYLADGAVIYGQNDQSATLTSSASTWTASAFAVTGALAANGTAEIGDAGDDVNLNLNVNATDGHWSGITITRTVKTGSAAEAFGQAMFINSSGELEAGDADVAASAAMPAICLLVTSGEGASKKCVTHGTVTETDWDWTVGGILYVSAAPGTTTGLTQSVPTASGATVQVVGVALSADTIMVQPSLTTIVLE